MRLLVLALVLPYAAHADDGVRRESITVGETIERDVGYAIGVICDHDVVVAEMTTRNDTNFVVFRGHRPGKTTCRAGTQPDRVSYVFDHGQAEATRTPTFMKPAPRLRVSWKTCALAGSWQPSPAAHSTSRWSTRSRR